MPPRKRNKALQAHAGRIDLISALEKMVPFLFKRRPPFAVRRSLDAEKVIKKTKAESRRTIVKKISTKKSATHHISAKKPSQKTARKAVAVIEARKQVKPPQKILADNELDISLIESGEASESVATELMARPATVIRRPMIGKLLKAPVQRETRVEQPEEGASLFVRKPKGAFILTEEPKQENAQTITAELLSGKDSFLDKVKKSELIGVAQEKKINGWSILKSRLFDRVPATQKPTQAAETLSAKDIANDSFLSRVQQKKSTDVVGTAVDEEVEVKVARSNDTSGSRGHILSAADLRKETKEAKEAALRLEKEVKEIKEEMRTSQKDREKEIEEIDKKHAEAKAQEPAAMPHRSVAMKRKSGFSRFLASLGHIGLGKERMVFVQNMAMMLNAGLPLIDSLKTLQMETRTKPMKKLLQKILDSVENGSPLWRAMEEQSFFSLHALALVRIGEEAGNLAQNMEYLAAQEEKDHELRSKVKMAMIYPSIVMTIMFIIVMGLGMFVLPNLIGVLFSLNVELPLVTRMVVAFSKAFTEYGAIAVPVSIGGFFGIIILAKYTPMRVVFQWMMFKVPGIGRLAREATIARFGVILGGLLKAGVPVVESMQSLVEVTPIVSYRKLYFLMLDHITIGDSFSKSFTSIKNSQKLLPPSVQQLVITGEKSGALADIMLKIADIYDKKASETAQKLPVILEPLLLLFIGGLVGTIAFAIIVPIYSIVGNVGR